MTLRRMDHVGIVVDDLPAAIAFFVELGLMLRGETGVIKRGARSIQPSRSASSAS